MLQVRVSSLKCFTFTSLMVYTLKSQNSLVLTIFNEEVYLTFKSIFHKSFNLF